jgi:hypothetical protein
MALQILDGTTAATEITLGVRSTYGGSAGAGVSLKCVLTYISMDVIREMFEQTTFCSSGWRSRIPGMKQMIGRADGFDAKGAVHCDPLLYFANNYPQAMVYTADTSCTLSSDVFINRRHSGMRAAGNSEAGYDIESFGAVTSAWVTS